MAMHLVQHAWGPINNVNGLSQMDPGVAFSLQYAHMPLVRSDQSMSALGANMGTWVGPIIVSVSPAVHATSKQIDAFG